ncbi:hypothetical protein V8E54_011507 [Elaphomyces granulatus]
MQRPLLRERRRNRIFTYDAWVGKGRDGEYTTMCRFLQEIELFLTLRHAIKYGDIGMIRRMLEPLAIFFFGPEQHKYGYEMLHLRWLLTDGVSDPVLQRSILASGLVNTLLDWKVFDLVIEHVNCMYKLDMRNLKNSTHDVNSTFDRLALICAFSTRLRRVIETYFGEKTKNDHTRRSVIAEVFGLAFKLWDDGRCAELWVCRRTGNVTRLDCHWLKQVGGQGRGPKCQSCRWRYHCHLVGQRVRDGCPVR